MGFVLVLYIYAGIFAKGDSVTLMNVPGFGTVQACQAAGKEADKLVSGSAKEVRFICVKAN